jgi:hypothetical protein
VWFQDVSLLFPFIKAPPTKGVFLCGIKNSHVIKLENKISLFVGN